MLNSKQIDLEKETTIAKNLGRYPILKALYPNEKYSLTTLAEKSNTDKGNLSRYLPELIEAGLLSRGREEGGRLKQITLTPLSRKLLETIITEASNGIHKTGEAETGFYLDLIKDNENSLIQKMAMEEIEVTSRKHHIKDVNRLLTFIKDRITDSKYKPLKLTMIQTTRNILTETDDETIGKIKKHLAEKLYRIPLDFSDISNTSKRVRYETSRLIPLLYKGEKGYRKMLEIYKKSIESDLMKEYSIRDMIVAQYPLKKEELKRELYSMYLKYAREGKEHEQKKRSNIEKEIIKLR
jgi:DNA-binding MarR family transcriptional regulator